MTEHDIASLQEELNEFQTEKDKIRRVVGQIGGEPLWILNAIEFRLNDVAKRIREIEKNIKSSVKNNNETTQG